MAGFWQWCRTGSRWCGQGVLWAVNLGLLGLAGVQGVGLVALQRVEEVQAPRWVGERINRELARFGWQVRFEKLSFDLRGYLRIAGVRLEDTRIDELLLEAREVRLDVDFSALLTGRLDLDAFRIEGARVQAPAMLNPLGGQEVLVERLLATGFRRGHRWHVVHAQGEIGPMAVRAAGTMAVPPPAQRLPPPPPEVVRRQVFRSLGQAAGVMPWIREAGAWQWQIEFMPDAAEQLRISLAGNVDNWEGGGVRLEKVRVVLPDLIAEEKRLPQGLRLHWARATGPEGIQLGSGSARVAPGEWGEAMPVRRVTFGVAGVRQDWINLEGVEGDLLLSDWPRLQGRVAARMGGRILLADANLEAVGWTGQVSVDSDWDLGAWINAAPLPFDLGKYFRFGGPPRIRAHAQLEAGGRPGWVEARAQLPHGGTILGWTIDRMSGRATWDGRMLRAEDLMIENPGYRATGTYEEDFATRAYRLRAKGTLYPFDLNPLFGDWWSEIWPQFQFGPAPEVDLAIAGWWNGSDERYIWGSVGATETGFRDVPLDRLDVRLRVEENYVDLYRLRTHGPMGTGSGELQFLLFPGTAQMFSTLLDIHAQALLGAVGRITGPEVASILDDFQTSGRPFLNLQGWFHEGSQGSWRDLWVGAHTAEPLAYRGIDLEDLALELRDHGSELILDPVNAGFAGGRGTGTGRFTGLGGPDSRLSLQLALEQTAYGPTLGLLRGLQPERPVSDPAAPAPTASSVPEPGTIDLTFTGEGKADDVASFTGAGVFHVKGADFAHVQIFGALSRLFEGTPIGFSTVRLEDARGNYRLGLEEVAFPDLNLTGPLSRADARGTMAREGGALDFRVRVFLLDETSNVFTGIFQPVFRPLGRILELRLRGTLDQPEWRLLFDPRNIFGGGSPPPSSPPPN